MIGKIIPFTHWLFGIFKKTNEGRASEQAMIEVMYRDWGHELKLPVLHFTISPESIPNFEQLHNVE